MFQNGFDQKLEAINHWEMESQQQKVREVLEKSFLDRQAKNPMFSLRAFSKQLGISPTALSQILSNKRVVSKRTLEKIYQNLDLDFKHSQIIEKALSEREEQQRESLPAADFRMVDDWYYFAILTLAQAEGFQDNPNWIAERLNISLREAKRALERLEQLELLKKTEKGLRRSGKRYQTTDREESFRIQKRHRQHLELATGALKRVSVNDRDFTSVSMAIDPKKLPEAKKMIRKFIDKMCKTLETGERTEVYIWCQQLFPLTQLDENADKEKS